MTRQNIIFCFDFVSSELLWPEGDEALSEHAVGAVESILILEAEHRPGAKGIALEGKMIAFSRLDLESNSPAIFLLLKPLFILYRIILAF